MPHKCPPEVQMEEKYPHRAFLNVTAKQGISGRILPKSQSYKTKTSSRFQNQFLTCNSDPVSQPASPQVPTSTLVIMKQGGGSQIAAPCLSMAMGCWVLLLLPTIFNCVCVFTADASFFSIAPCLSTTDVLDGTGFCS